MEALAKNIKLQYNEHQQPEIVLSTTLPRQEALKQYQKLKQITDKDKLLKVAIKQYRQKRSLDANAMLWSILGEMAVVLNTTKDELYLEMLSRYGVFTHIIVKPEIVDRVKEEWRTVRELGEVTVNGKTGMQLQCFFGSSTYNSKEFSVLLDGVISEAKEIGIDVITEYEKQTLINEWGNK